MASSPFCYFLTLGAGVTPAEGSMKPTAGFILIKFRVRCSGYAFAFLKFGFRFSKNAATYSLCSGLT